VHARLARQVSRDEVMVASDSIDGGHGKDTLVGDQGLIMAPASVSFDSTTFTADALECHGFLRDLEHAAVDFDFAVQEAHRDVLVALVDDAIEHNPSKKKPQADQISDLNHHDLFLRNDVITGGENDDVIICDDAALLVPLVAGGTTRNEHRSDLAVDKDLLKTTEELLKDQQYARKNELKDHIDDHHDDVKKRLPKGSEIELIPYRFQFDAVIGHDTISGNEGNDALIGDFGIIVSPGLLETPTAKNALQHTSNDIDKLVRDVAVSLNDHAQDLSSREGKYSHHELQKHHGGSAGGSDSPFRDGADVMDGGIGNDIMLGDNGTITLFIDDKIAYDPAAFVVSTAGRLGHGSDGGSDGGSDLMHGGDGDDILFGQNGADTLLGEGDDDLLFGGNGIPNVIDRVVQQAVCAR
jgi:Ca2+-binding RTX toxin-like protein